MKFKAILSRSGVKVFLGIAQSLQKLSEECAIHMNEESFEFRIKPDVSSEVQVFAKIYTESFIEYLIQSKAENNISVVVRVKNLIRAFRSADKAVDAVLKLTKPNGIPCFSIIASEISSCLAVKQDIPIAQLLSTAGLSEYREPRLPSPDITMEFPDPRTVRVILERMKPMDKFVTVEATSKGNLIFKVQTEIVSMRTFFQGLDVQQISETDENDDAMSVRSSNTFRSSGGINRRVSVQMNIKELLNVLQFASIHAEKVLLCIIKDRAMVLYADLENQVGSLTYYIPVCTEL